MSYTYRKAYREMLFGEEEREKLPVIEDMGAMATGVTTDGAMQASGVSDDPDMKTNVMNVGRKNVMGATQRRGIGTTCTCKPKKKNCKKCMKPAQETVEGIDPESAQQDPAVDKLSDKLGKLFKRKVVKESGGKYFVFKENDEDQHFSMLFKAGETDNEAIVEMEPVEGNVVYTIKMSNQTPLVKIVEFIKKKLEE